MDHLQLFEEKGADLMVKNGKGQGLLHVVATMGVWMLLSG